MIPAGETNKDLTHVQYITEQLIRLQADRGSLLVGMGGGMITDLSGFVAATYMRGISCGFLPTTLLAMVDAATGGKNGINLGFYKNMLGAVRQPEFILFDEHFLKTLPDEEWSNGFAEIIKYSCILDSTLFDQLNILDIRLIKTQNVLSGIIQKCVHWKNTVVVEDEQEQGTRKLLNFGHTVGHAVENLYKLSHGAAVAVGMMIACKISEKITGLDPQVTQNLKVLLDRYGLPSCIRLDTEEVMNILRMDKKRRFNSIDFVVLERIGRARIEPIPFTTIREIIAGYQHDGKN